MTDRAIIQRLRMLLKDEKLIEKYLSQYGEVISIPNIKAIKDQQEQEDLFSDLQDLDIKPIEETEINIGEDPIYENLLICPICKNRHVTSYNLRAKSQFVTENLFLVPIYAGIGKYKKENFTMLSTTVCNDCLFASPDPKDFSKFVEYTKKTVESQLLVHHRLLFYLEDTARERIQFLRESGMIKPDFSRPRSVETAILSIRLSIIRAEAEEKHDLQNTLFKRGSYNLRIAQIEKETNQNNVESLSAACTFFERAVLESDCNSFEIELEAIYLVIALSIKLGEKDRVSAFFKIIKDTEIKVTEELKENPTLLKYKKKHATMEKWEKRAKTALEYRDDEEYWKDV